MSLPPDTTLDEVKVRIREAYSNPNVGKIIQVVLKDGPQTFRIATLLEIIKPKTGELHHYSLKIDHIVRKKKAGWFTKPERSVRLEGESPDEIDRLYMFLHALKQGGLTEEQGALHLIRSEDYARLESLLGALPNLPASDKIQLIRTLFDQLEDSPALVADFVSAFEESSFETLRHIATSARFLEYRESYKLLQQLVQDPSTPEHDFQRHLSNNPWMFGSEYSELLSRRTWTRDDNLDYMLRRTVDGYLEIVEIKTAFSDRLFIYDSSHESYYPSAKLSPVLGQVVRYIEEVDRNRDSIIAKDKVDTLKIRARAIVGRDGDAEQQAALRNLNAHLHGIEIITYDQLLRIAARVLNVFANATAVPPENDAEPEVPF
jgi:Shedu protein SduA, C-terminal